MNDITIHIGYHKTATTWMQEVLFKQDYGYSSVASHQDVFSNLVKPDGFRFEPKHLRNIVDSKLNRIAENQTAIISSELLSGHPYDGNRGADIYAQRLKQIFGVPKVIISIRSQLKILPSVYMHYLRFGGTMSWKDFFDGASELEYYGFTPDHFEYDRLISYYYDLFGENNVLVVTQESMSEDIEKFCKQIALFSGNSIYSRLSSSSHNLKSPSYLEYAAPILRRVNHFQESPINPNPVIKLGKTPKGPYRYVGYFTRQVPLSSFFGALKPVSMYVNERYKNYFSESNARLAKLINHPIDLSSYK